MEIKQFLPKYLSQVAGLYDRVFTGSPWFDDPLGLEQAINYIQGELAKPYAVALLALSDDLPIGFAWAYQSEGFPREKYTPENIGVINQVVPIKTYSYISEVGIDPKYQNQRIGTSLTNQLAMKLPLPWLMRTLETSPMLAIATKKLKMLPAIAPWLINKDPENVNRVILLKYD